MAGVRKQEDVSALKALNNPSIKPVILDVTSKSSIDKAFDTVVAECKASNKVRHTPLSFTHLICPWWPWL